MLWNSVVHNNLEHCILSYLKKNTVAFTGEHELKNTNGKFYAFSHLEGINLLKADKKKRFHFCSGAKHLFSWHIAWLNFEVGHSEMSLWLAGGCFCTHYLPIQSWLLLPWCPSLVKSVVSTQEVFGIQPFNNDVSLIWIWQHSWEKNRAWWK